MLFGSKVIINCGFQAAILKFDLIRLSNTQGDGLVVFAIVGNPKFGVGIAKRVHMQRS